MSGIIRRVSLMWTDPPFAWSYWMMRIADWFDPNVPSDIEEYETVESHDNEG